MTLRGFRSLCGVVLGVVLSTGFARPVSGQTSYDWTVTSDTNWNTSANWSPLGPPALTGVDTANFALGTGSVLVNLANEVSLSRFNFAGSTNATYVFSNLTGGSPNGAGIRLVGSAPTLQIGCVNGIAIKADLSAISLTVGDGTNPTTSTFTLTGANNGLSTPTLTVGNLTVTNNAALNIVRNQFGSTMRNGFFAVTGQLTAQGDVGVSVVSGTLNSTMNGISGNGKLTGVATAAGASPAGYLNLTVTNFEAAGGLTLSNSVTATIGTYASNGGITLYTPDANTSLSLYLGSVSGANSPTINLAGGTALLTITNTSTFSSPVNIAQNAVLRITSGNNHTFAGGFTGSGSFQKIGSGTFSISSYNAGPLSITNSSSVIVTNYQSTAVATINGPSSLLRIFDYTANAIINVPLGGLAVTNSFQGGTVFLGDGGGVPTLTLGGGSTAASMLANLTVSSANGAIFDNVGTNLQNSLTGSVNLFGEITFSGASSTHLTVGSKISGPAGILKQGVGSAYVYLSNATNDYTGRTTIAGGAMVAMVNAPSGAAGALGNSTTPIVLGTSTTAVIAQLLTGAEVTIARDIAGTDVAAAGTLQIGTLASVTSTFSGNITLSDGISLTTPGTSRVYLTGVIAKGGPGVANIITKTGGGTAVITGSNSFDGGVVIQNGVIETAHAQALGLGTVTLGIAGVASASSALVTGAPITVTNPIGVIDYASGATALLGGSTAVTSTFSGAITLSDNLTLTSLTGGKVVLTGNIANAAGITNAGLFKRGVGTLVLAPTSGNNSFDGGTTIFGGAVQFNSFASGLAGGNLRFAAVSGTQAVVEASGTQNYAVGTAANQLQWIGSGGFAAAGSSDLTVTLNSGAVMQWGGTVGFVPTGSDLQLGSMSSSATVNLTNDIDLNGAARIIAVSDGAANVDAIISGLISNGSVTKSQSGTLLFTADNAYTGTTYVVAGTLRLGNGGAGGSVAGNLNVAAGASTVVNRTAPSTFLQVLGGGTIEIVNDSVINLSSNNSSFTGSFLVSKGTLNVATGGSISNAALITLSDPTSKLIYSRDSGTVAIDAVIEGPGSVEKTGAATVTLGGNNTFTGALTLAAGNMTIGGTLTTPTINITGLTSVLLFSRDVDATYTGRITGAGASLRKIGTGMLVLTGQSDYTGTTSVLAGELRVNGALGPGNVTVGTAAALSGIGVINGKLTLSTDGVLAPGINPAGHIGGVGTMTVANVSGGATTLTINGGNSLIFDLATPAASDRLIIGDPASAAPQVKALASFVFNPMAGFGNGDYVLISGYSGALDAASFAFLTQSYSIDFGGTTYGGTLLNNSGSLVLHVTDGSSGDPKSLTWAGGDGAWNTTTANWTGEATVYSSGDDVTFGNIAGTTSVTIISGGVTPGSVVVDNDVSHPYAFLGGAIGGTTTLVKQGAGTLTLSNDNTFTGTTTIAGGTLKMAGSFASTSIAVDGNLLQFITEGTQTIGGVISGNGALQKLGTGTTVLTAQNTFSGTTSVDAGTLLVDNALGGTIYVNSGGAFLGSGVNGSTVVFAGGSGTVSGTQTGTTTVNSGTVTVTSGGTLEGLVTVNGGTLNIGSGAAVTGTISLSSGALSLLAGGSADSTPGITVGSAGTFNVAGGTVVGNGTINVGGSFVANGTVGQGSASVVVTSGGTLSGTGVIQGGVSVESGGTLSPGNSVESLGMGNLSLTHGSTLVFEFRDAEGTYDFGGGNSGIGYGWDLIDLGNTGILDLGDATANNPITVNVSAFALDNSGHADAQGDLIFDPNDDYEWLFIKVADLDNLVTNGNGDDFSRRFHIVDTLFNGGVFDTGNGNPFDRADYTTSLGQPTFSVAWKSGAQGLGLYVRYSAVPEPGTIVLTGLASLGAGWYGRRRRRAANSAG